MIIVLVIVLKNCIKVLEHIEVVTRLDFLLKKRGIILAPFNNGL